MERVKKLVTNERGVILVISLLIMALLIGAGVGAIVSMQTDLRTSSNLKTGTQAFDVADAGIEWARQKLKRTTTNPPTLSALCDTTTESSCNVTKTVGTGSFTVTFIGSPSSPAKVDKLVATVNVESEGTVGTSKAKIQALLRKTYELADGALSVRGDADTNLSGTSFTLDGRDYNTTGTLKAGAKAAYGFSTETSSLDAEATSQVAANQESSIVGKGGTTPNIEQSDLFPQSEMTQLATDLCNDGAAASQTTGTTTSTGGNTNGTFTVTGGNPPTLDIPTGQTWGLPTSPVVRCINGPTTSSDDLVKFAGNFTGYGILVIRNANVEIAGAFRWEGLIMITGSNVGLQFSGGGNKDVFGSIMINETNPDDPSRSGGNCSSGCEVDLAGNVNVKYSSSALQNAITATSGTNPLQNVFDTMPSMVTAVYWRTVSN